MITYTNYFNGVLTDLQTVLTTEFSQEMAILIGDRPVITNYPCIILEPVDKDISADVSIGKKDFEFSVNIWVYRTHSQDDDGVQLTTETLERIEELLIVNRQYPISSGASWYISFPGKAQYGQILKGGELLRTAKLEWKFKKRVIRN